MERYVRVGSIYYFYLQGTWYSLVTLISL